MRSGILTSDVISGYWLLAVVNELGLSPPLRQCCVVNEQVNDVS